MAKGLGEGNIYWDNLATDLANIKISVDALIVAFNKHTHAADGSEAAGYQTSVPASDVATLVATTAITVADLPALKS